MAAEFEQATSADLGRSGAIFTRAGFDPIALLPAAAGERLRQLRQKARDAHSLVPEFDDRYSANAARGDAERRLQRLLAHRSEGGFALLETDPQIIEQKKLIQKLADEARRLSELDEVRSEQWRSASRVVQAVEAWLKDGGVPPGVMLEDHEVDVPKLAKGENLLDAIENRRRRVRELRADLHRIRSAPYLSAHVRAKIRQEVEALATQGAPSVSDVVEHDRKIIWPMLSLRSTVYNTEVPSFAATEVVDVHGLFAAVHKTALLAYLDALVTEEADDPAALSHTEREKRLSEVQQDQLATEYSEAALVWAAMAERLPAEHRSDCAPQCILQCKLTTAPAVNGGGTLQHVIDIIGGVRR